MSKIGPQQEGLHLNVQHGGRGLLLIQGLGFGRPPPSFPSPPFSVPFKVLMILNYFDMSATLPKLSGGPGGGAGGTTKYCHSLTLPQHKSGVTQ